MSDTSYAVLRQQNEGRHEEPGVWTYVGDQMASSPAQALRRYIDFAGTQGKPADGTYAVTPTRSFKVSTVKVETRSVVTLGDANKESAVH